MDGVTSRLPTLIIVACIVYGLNLGCDAAGGYTGICAVSSECRANCSNIRERFQNISNGEECPSGQDTDCRCKKMYYTLEVEENDTDDKYDTVSVNIQFKCASDQDIVDYKSTKDITEIDETHPVEIQGETQFITTPEKNFSVEVPGGEVNVTNPGGNMTAAVTSATTRDREVDILEEDNTVNKHLLGDPGRLIIVTTEPQSKEVILRFENKNPPLSYLEDYKRLLNASRLCGFFDSRSSKWNTSACVVISATATDTTCRCEHNSAFAVIFAVRQVYVNPQLSTASTVLEIVSMVCLALSAVLLGFYRQRMRNFDRVLVQICLCIALFLTHLFIISSGLALHNPNGCLAVAVIAHYFLTATAVLMVMEGMLMLIKVLAPNFLTSASSNSKRRRGIGFVVAWIVPLLYVGGCAAYGIQDLGKGYAEWSSLKDQHQSCWISQAYWYLVAVPVAISLFINTCIAIRLGVLVWSMSKSAEEFKPSNQRDVNKASHSGKAFRAVVILMPILGIPWVIGFLINIPNLELVFMSIHVVVNGLQGVLLLCHYVIFNSEMRACVKRSWKTAMSNFGSLATPTVQFVSTGSTSVQNTSDKRSESTVGLHEE